MAKKRCKACRKQFAPTKPMQTTCSFECAIEYSKKPKAQKAYKIENKKLLKDKYPDMTKLRKSVQDLAQKYGRLREIHRGNNFCVTCGATNCKFDGGHFLPKSTYTPIRYYTLQINPQCVKCNQYNGGMPIAYKEYMIKRFGIKKVEWLESTHRESRTYDIEYLKKYLKVMRKRIKRYL